MNTTDINKNLTAPSVTIAPRNPARGVLTFVVTLTTFKDVRSYPCRSLESATKLAERFIAGVTKPARPSTPEAEAARRELLALTPGRPNNVTMCYHWARTIELLHAIEVIRDLLEDPDLQGDALVSHGPRREEAVGLVEAPRGTLFHHYRVNQDDEVTMCN